MKRYKPSFFIKQAFKGMFRNGMMTAASVIVLLACLTVLGVFTSLVRNIDYNLGSLDNLNEIVAFADTGKGYSDGNNVILADEPKADDGSRFVGWSLKRGSDTPDYRAGDVYKILETDSVGGAITFYAVWENAPAPNSIKIEYNLSGLKINEDLTDETEYGDGDKFNLPEAVTAKGSSVEFLGWSSIPNADVNEFKPGEKYTVYADKAKGGIITLYAIWSEKPVFASYNIKYDCGTASVPELPSDSDTRLKSVIQSVNAIKSETIDEIKFVSKEETLKDEMAQLEDYPGLATFFEGADNPYPDTFIITYLEGADVEAIEQRLASIKDIYKIRCNSEIAKSISELKNGVSMIFFWFAVILFAVSVLVIVNTVKLAVEYRSKEIVIMRYIGATKSFIALPFELEGIIIGAFAGLVSFGIQWLAYSKLASLIAERLPMISMVGFGDLWVLILAEAVVIGVVTGLLGSVISIYKYLRA